MSFDAQFVADMIPVVLNGAYTDEDLFCDLFAGEILSHKLQYPPFSRREVLECWNILCECFTILLSFDEEI